MELPKNIRQIALPDEKNRIYIEDYVSTYLHRLEKTDTSPQKVCALLGKKEEEEGRTYYFLSGCVLVEEEWLDLQKDQFDDNTWSHIYQLVQSAFPTLSILGWAVIRSEFAMKSIALPEEQPLVLMMDKSMENEEQITLRHGKKKHTIGGYFIYYERNEAMQNYMQGAGTTSLVSEPEEVEIESVKQDAAIHFRTLLNNRKEEASQKKVMTYLYLTSSFLVMIIFVIGVTMINNYDRMNSMEKSLTHISASLSEEISEGDKTDVAERMDADDQTNDDEQASTDEQTDEDGQADPALTSAATEMSPAISQELTISETGETASDDTTSVPSTQCEYIVSEGDTLASICRKHYGGYEMMDTVCEVNGITDRNQILYGQKILLP